MRRIRPDGRLGAECPINFAYTAVALFVAAFDWENHGAARCANPSPTPLLPTASTTAMDWPY